jgi:retron-type reverse transcriptase
MHSKILSKAQDSITKAIDLDVKNLMRSYISNIFLIVYTINNIFTNKKLKLGRESSICYGRLRDRKTKTGFENAANLALKINNTFYKNCNNKSTKHVYITKLNSIKLKQISRLSDHIIQKMFQLVIEPVVDTFGDPNSYAFRKHRSCKNAIGALASRIVKASDNFTIIKMNIEKFYNKINRN